MAMLDVVNAHHSRNRYTRLSADRLSDSSVRIDDSLAGALAQDNAEVFAESGSVMKSESESDTSSSTHSSSKGSFVMTITPALGDSSPRLLHSST